MQTTELAKLIRVTSLKMCHDAKTSHIGSCLSCADILAVLYNEILKDDDRFIVSKGHCASAVYATLWAIKDKIPREWIDNYSQDGAKLGGHVTYGVPDVEFSTGSLGHGLAVACGMALSDRAKRVFCLMGDGETNEGSVWEAARFAHEYKLDNLIAIVDNNRWQSLSYCHDKLNHKFNSFGWAIHVTSGHNISRLSMMLQNMRNHHLKKPQCIIAHTAKGKGVSWMEHKVEWHYKCPSDEELKMALEELK